MVSFEPPTLMISGTKGNTTEVNILETKCFCINFVDSSIVSKVYECITWHGQERIEKTGLTLGDASTIDAPLINECRAHLECILHDTVAVGSGFVIFGEIVAASIWEEIVHAEPERRYELLDEVVFLEKNLYSRISNVSRVKSK